MSPGKLPACANPFPNPIFLFLLSSTFLLKEIREREEREPQPATWASCSHSSKAQPAPLNPSRQRPSPSLPSFFLQRRQPPLSHPPDPLTLFLSSSPLHRHPERGEERDPLSPSARGEEFLEPSSPPLATAAVPRPSSSAPSSVRAAVCLDPAPADWIHPSSLFPALSEPCFESSPSSSTPLASLVRSAPSSAPPP